MIEIEQAKAANEKFHITINGKKVYGSYNIVNGKSYYRREDKNSLSGDETLAIRDWLDANG